MIMYLSKGRYYQDQGSKIMVNRGVRNAMLSGIYSYLWSIGSRRFVVVKDPREIVALEKLNKMGLVAMKETESDNDKYEILTHCVMTLSDKDGRIENEGFEHEVYVWLKEAALNLSIAELIKLTELNISPSDEWLGKDNLYKLVMSLYAPLSSDRMLEFQMKDSEVRDKVVGAVENLLGHGIIQMM